MQLQCVSTITRRDVFSGGKERPPRTSRCRKSCQEKIATLRSSTLFSRGNWPNSHLIDVLIVNKSTVAVFCGVFRAQLAELFPPVPAPDFKASAKRTNSASEMRCSRSETYFYEVKTNGPLSVSNAGGRFRSHYEPPLLPTKTANCRAPSQCKNY